MSLTVYACGGAAANIARQIKDLDVAINYIDTSKSNLGSIKSDNVYLVEDMDGAGKDRALTYQNFKGSASDVLTRFKPSEQLNIVMSSLTGGSGGILASLLAKELISQGHNTIVIGVDSHHSLVELHNSVKTLKTYKAISTQINKPVPLYYISQPSRTDADRQALFFISLMTLIIDKKRTAEFDNSDLGSFLYFDRTTVNAPSVSIVEVSTNETLVAEKNTSVVGTILVTANPNAAITPVIPEYLATCVVLDKDYKNEDARINAVLGKLSVIIDALDTQIKALEDTKKINKIREVDVQGSNDDGIVL